MHESTRRLLCRVAFLLGCVVPTVCTLSWITYRQSAWAVEAVEHELSQTIGLKCQIARYYNPKPTKWIFEDVHLERAGEDAVVFPVLKAELVDNTWQLSADQAEVDWASRNRLWETIQEGILLKRRGAQALHLNVAEVRFRDESQPPLRHLSIQYDPTAQPALTSIAMVGSTQVSPTLQLTLDTTAGAPWKLQLKTDRLPTDRLAVAVPHLAGLGPDAYYQGQMTFELVGDSPNVELRGEIYQMDLATALASKFGLHGAGGADLYLQSVVIRQNTVHWAKGVLASKNGQISRRLLNRAAQHLQLRVVPPSQNEDLLAYHELAIGFSDDQGRLTLSGLCEDMPHGTMLAGLEHPLAMEGLVNTLPATNLASVFHEDHSPSVPASQRSVDMARWLAVPQLAERTGNPLR
ncbi:hypothetical protein [Blastopirellula marina]|uniref:AsmA-like C-terminal domain-containing protein n=1 Tax=Blastopirellula marina TaxID=124 RepID=A0A2S8F7W7_9BACT|nr:hypothetical protein [Blastopirellula marina]PQO28220.1 hypothetical protein C5Y98_25315 [Blastopirellula marina]PTL41760.1 hypothetical protein C5Y97_25330 [Blastopirellula marina]